MNALLHSNISSEDESILAYLERETERLVASGGIELDEFGDNYEAPKIVLNVALKNLAFQFSPLSANGKAAAKNLSRF